MDSLERITELEARIAELEAENRQLKLVVEEWAAVSSTVRVELDRVRAALADLGKDR
jgi:uncharacterized coiled-coil protein SlyX